MRIISSACRWLREVWQGYADEYASAVAYTKSLIEDTNKDKLHWFISDEIETEYGVGFYFKVVERKDITFSIGYSNVGLANPHILHVNRVQIEVPRKWLERLHTAIRRNMHRRDMRIQEEALKIQRSR